MAKKQKDSLPAEPAAATTGQPSPRPARQKTKKSADKGGGFYWGTGRRKSSVARVRIRPGQGKLMINKRQLDNYFTQPQDRKNILAPLQAIGAAESFDIFVNVQGGGSSGQAGAVVLGIARALLNFDENYSAQLRDGGYLTRDGRMKERKKYGQRGARRRFQFSKR